MPSHAKIVTAFLAINALLSIIPLAEVQDTMTVIGALIPVLLLLGFLKGSEGVRMLLLIGAFCGLLIGAVAIIQGVANLDAGGFAMLALATGAWTVVANGYMLYALRHPEVERWMLGRSLGLDEDEM